MDGRFYLLSLIAIFLALALGIVLGVHLPGSEALLISEEFLVSGIEKEFARLSEEMAQLNEQVRSVEEERGALRRSLDVAMQFAVEGRLEGVTVELLVSSKMEEEAARRATEDLTGLLSSAGARVRVGDYPALVEQPASWRPAGERKVQLLLFDSERDATAAAGDEVVVGVWDSDSVIPTTMIKDRGPVRDVGTPVGNLFLVLALADRARELGGR
ncbi:MAG: copper transporter [Bacillota bacterium]